MSLERKDLHLFVVDVQFTGILELADRIIFHFKLIIIILKKNRTHPPI